jgi:hypothetical protein
LFIVWNETPKSLPPAVGGDAGLHPDKEITATVTATARQQQNNGWLAGVFCFMRIIGFARP